jgi:hypothetical protein
MWRSLRKENTNSKSLFLEKSLYPVNLNMYQNPILLYYATFAKNNSKTKFIFMPKYTTGVLSTWYRYCSMSNWLGLYYINLKITFTQFQALDESIIYTHTNTHIKKNLLGFGVDHKEALKCSVIVDGHYGKQSSSKMLIYLWLKIMYKHNCLNTAQ